MFVGRKDELDLLNNLYNNNNFSLLVMYGRRRVGKTSILQEFTKANNVLYFPAQEQNNALNLKTFAQHISKFFKDDYVANFTDWDDALSYLTKQISTLPQGKKFALIIDEFPFIAKEYPAIKSILQHTIDHVWKNKNIMLVLCGSSVSFMINEVLGYSSPLYARVTHQLEVKPFDYLITNKLFPKMSNIDKIITYSILGGIPLYLNNFDEKKSIRQNLIDSVLSPNSLLYNEPTNLLRAELREPIFYNTLLQSIASGNTKLNEIADSVHEESNKCAKYIDTLKEIRLVEKTIPYGEPTKSKKGIYKLSDNFYAFWYKYIFNKQNELELIGKNNYANEIIDNLPNFIGPIFEKICEQYMVKLAKANKLPFIPNGFGKWWGNNPTKKSEDDVDILGIKDNQGIFCECKFRNEKFDLAEFKDLICASNIFKSVTNKYYYIFVKSGYTQAVIEESKKYNVKLLTIDDLFKV